MVDDLLVVDEGENELNECQVGIVVAVSTPIKYATKVVLRDLLPGVSGERSLLRSNQRWNRGWRLVCRWTSGILAILILTGAGFGALALRSKLTQMWCNRIGMKAVTFFVSFFVGQAYQFVAVVSRFC